MAILFAFANQKGGVAKTTSVASLGGALVERGSRVLVVDLDPQGNLSLAVGINPRRLHHHVSDLLLNATPAQDLIVQTRTPGLDLLPSGRALTLAERYLPTRPHYQTILSTMLRPLPYDYIILDCPPALGTITATALAATDVLVIPTQAEYFSAYALQAMLAMIRQVRATTNPHLAYRVLITMFRTRTRALRIIKARLEATFGQGLFQTTIEVDTKLREAAIAGLPITHYAPKSRAARQYRALAQELLDYVQTQETASVRTA
ncbi:MAG TPA: ParA family protein [Anaerolineae bacterium]|nr:ParA family protein [Anaerolineae bacterium]HID84546.1 ParA family protein [Anaerolineales bacterium]HIQ09299.1 ParA family protein [Anaerolineaceae bacterium]